MSKNTETITVDGATYQVTPHAKKEVAEVLSRFEKTVVRAAKAKPKAGPVALKLETVEDYMAYIKELHKAKNALPIVDPASA